MPESWTAKRLDDLNAKVAQGFGRLDADMRLQRVETRTEFTAVRGEIRTEFAAVRSEMKSGFERMDERFERMDQRFEALHRLLLRGAGVVVTALVGLVATQL